MTVSLLPIAKVNVSGPMQTQPPRRAPSFPDQAEVIDDEHSPSTQSKVALPVSTHGRERGVLVVLSGMNAGQVFSVEREETIIGRSRSAQVRVDDNGVSRKNTRITRVGSKFFIEDLSSLNGTFKNGERVTKPIELLDGDRVHAGPTLAFRFGLLDEAEEVLARQLYEASTRDPLTRAYNRRYFMQRLVAETAFAQRHETKLSIVMLDVDHFKLVNDTWGHHAGDEVLKTIATAIQGAIRTEDVFARYGGEELAVLVRGVDHRGAAAFAERLRQTVSRLEVHLDGASIHVTVSAGVASLSECKSHDEMLALSDERLYRAKDSGRNSVCA